MRILLFSRDLLDPVRYSPCSLLVPAEPLGRWQGVVLQLFRAREVSLQPHSCSRVLLALCPQ